MFFVFCFFCFFFFFFFFSSLIFLKALQSLIISVPKKSLLLIEDIDAAFHQGIQDDAKVCGFVVIIIFFFSNLNFFLLQSAGKTRSRLSLSGLLNAIDGVISQQGCLLFLTTNNLQELPDRLIRSGRIDVRCEFGLASKSQIRGLFRLYFGSGLQAQEEQFVSACPEGKYSCSEVIF